MSRVYIYIELRYLQQLPHVSRAIGRYRIELNAIYRFGVAIYNTGGMVGYYNHYNIVQDWPRRSPEVCNCIRYSYIYDV